MNKVWIIGRSGTYANAKIEVEGAILMGRDPKVCQLIFSPGDSKVSSVHCKIEKRDGGCYLTDLNSTNGTFLDDGTKLPPQSARRITNGQGFYLAGNRECSFSVEETIECQPKAEEINLKPAVVKEKNRTPIWAIAVIIILLIAGTATGYAYYQESNKSAFDKVKEDPIGELSNVIGDFIK